MNASQSRPPRTLGLILAIATSVTMFSLIPLMQVAMVAAIQARVGTVIATLPETGEDGRDLQAFASGGSFEGAEPIRLATQTMLALIFLAIAILAWHGRMRRIRLIYSLTVALYSALTVALALGAVLTPADPTQGLDSGTEIARSLLVVQVLTTLLVMLYVLWYVNRAPARAFFRGYYLPTKE